MAELVADDKATEVVVPLSAMLETPNEPEVEEVETEVVDAVAVVEEKIEEAKVEGASKEEINELRGLLRELRNNNISLQARLNAAERVQKGEFGEDGKDVKLSAIEEYQVQLNQAASRNDLSGLLVVMEVNPKYEDVNEVCSASNFDDIFERVAQFRSNEAGSDFSTELIKVKAEVWSLPNPYKYMYEAIKEYHPAYVKKTVTPEPVADKGKTAKEVLKVVTAPGSVANLGTGDETKGGWTAEKIDSMPEGELSTVPKDIYKKWLNGELD
jgi:hypothetical protein